MSRGCGRALTPARSLCLRVAREEVCAFGADGSGGVHIAEPAAPGRFHFDLGRRTPRAFPFTDLHHRASRGYFPGFSSTWNRTANTKAATITPATARNGHTGISSRTLNVVSGRTPSRWSRPGTTVWTRPRAVRLIEPSQYTVGAHTAVALRVASTSCAFVKYPRDIITVRFGGVPSQRVKSRSARTKYAPWFRKPPWRVSGLVTTVTVTLSSSPGARTPSRFGPRTRGSIRRPWSIPDSSTNDGPPVHPAPTSRVTSISRYR